jgi:hypothetical protein
VFDNFFNSLLKWGIDPTFLMDKSKLFHCLMVDGMYESFVMETLYNGIRNDLLNCLDWLPNDCHLDLNLLIFGNSTLTNEQNELVLKKVFDYIRTG